MNVFQIFLYLSLGLGLTLASERWVPVPPESYDSVGDDPESEFEDMYWRQRERKGSGSTVPESVLYRMDPELIGPLLRRGLFTPGRRNPKRHMGMEIPEFVVKTDGQQQVINGGTGQKGVKQKLYSSG